jgi:hypothetical protein
MVGLSKFSHAYTQKQISNPRLETIPLEDAITLSHALILSMDKYKERSFRVESDKLIQSLFSGNHRSVFVRAFVGVIQVTLDEYELEKKRFWTRPTETYFMLLHIVHLLGSFAFDLLKQTEDDRWFITTQLQLFEAIQQTESLAHNTKSMFTKSLSGFRKMLKNGHPELSKAYLDLFTANQFSTPAKAPIFGVLASALVVPPGKTILLNGTPLFDPSVIRVRNRSFLWAFHCKKYNIHSILETITNLFFLDFKIKNQFIENYNALLTDPIQPSKFALEALIPLVRSFSKQEFEQIFVVFKRAFGRNPKVNCQ